MKDYDVPHGKQGQHSWCRVLFWQPPLASHTLGTAVLLCRCQVCLLLTQTPPWCCSAELLLEVQLACTADASSASCLPNVPGTALQSCCRECDCPCTAGARCTSFSVNVPGPVLQSCCRKYSCPAQQVRGTRPAHQASMVLLCRAAAWECGCPAQRAPSAFLLTKRLHLLRCRAAAGRRAGALRVPPLPHERGAGSPSLPGAALQSCCLECGCPAQRAPSAFLLTKRLHLLRCRAAAGRRAGAPRVPPLPHERGAGRLRDAPAAQRPGPPAPAATGARRHQAREHPV